MRTRVILWERFGMAIGIHFRELADFLDRRSREVEHDLEATLAKLRAYRQRDPHFAEAIAAVSEAEGRAGKNDPAEGKIVLGKLVGGQLVDERTSESVSPLQADVRRMLNAT